MQSKKGISMKVIVLVLTVGLLLGGTIGGTVAWLATKTKPVTNTFVAGDINITLEESITENNSLKMVPGADITKDPVVTVVGGSEPCWLFVTVEESGGNVTVGGTEYKFSDFISYTVEKGTAPDTEWTELATGVYYRNVEAADTDQEFKVLSGDKVTVRSTVKKSMLDALTSETNPKLIFTAYAIQQSAEFDTAEKAWAKAQSDAELQTSN